MRHISICFAVYQNEGSLIPLYEQMVFELKTHFQNYTYELIFVNDGSTDNSLNELISLQKKDKNVKVISFSRNFGQKYAIFAGWKYAKGDAVINMAADLQDPPKQCTQMIKEWEKGSEIVISYRKSHKTQFVKRITSRLFYKLLFPKTPKGGFDFTLLDRKPLDAMNLLKEKHRSYQYDILWIGYSVKFIPYDKMKREIGKSQFSFIKRLKAFYSTLLIVSYLPLRILSMIGVITAILGFIYAGLIVHSYFVHNTPFKGWAPIMILILIIGGLIMLMIGILGEYIWRISDEVKGRPNYIIKDIYSSDKD